MNHGVTWTEFSAQVPSSGQAFKIGEVFQASVGSLPYAIEMAATGKKAREALSFDKAMAHRGHHDQR